MLLLFFFLNKQFFFSTVDPLRLISFICSVQSNKIFIKNTKNPQHVL